MTGNLKHDLRTPLNHIIGYCEMLLEEGDDLPNKEFVADLERIHVAGRRLLTVTNELFDPAKSAAYKANPNLINHEIRTPLNQIIGYAEMLQEEAKESGESAFAADFEKILTAARELLRLVTENFVTTESQRSQAEKSVPQNATVFFRRDTASPQPAPGNRLSAISASGSILVVDDDAGNREMLSRRLVRLGYNVSVAENGRHALGILKTSAFDLLLLDIQMPELNGYEVLEQLRADSAFRDIPVIVLSASDDTVNVVRCIEMGAEDYLSKPFDPILLQARIGALLEKKRFRDREVSYLRQIQEEKQRSDELLHIILPGDVAAELKATNAVKPRRFENVGVLFCDIVEFTAYCDLHPPEDVHSHLQALVEEFERIVIAHGLEKIKTIGDSFMATAGLPGPSENPALECVRCGLEMIAAAQSLPPYWKLRMGVHVGPLIAGVVGSRKYQYDIWGDTVNIAARMMQAATPGNISVTAETWGAVDSHCDGVKQGLVSVKGKGDLLLYSISGMRGK